MPNVSAIDNSKLLGCVLVAENTLTMVRGRSQKIDFPTKFVFDVLESVEIRYALIRGFEELLEAHGNIEVDLLVHPHDVEKMAAAMAGHGFVEILSQGHAPHRFFVAFSTELGHWIKLDVVSDFFFGSPVRKYPAAMTDIWELRRKKEIFLLAYEHELLGLLLHCLLDKGRFDEKHRQRLSLLMNMAAEDEGIEKKMRVVITQHLQPEFSWEGIFQAIKSGDWERLLSKRARINSRFSRQSGLKSKWFEFKTLLQRRFRLVYFAKQKHGVSVALLAPDGAGKSTLAASLVQDKFLRARMIYMGSNLDARTIGLRTTPFLTRLVRKINKHNKRKTLYGMSIRALNLVNSLLDHWYRCLAARYQLLRGRFVVFDRFIYDAWIQKKQTSPWKRLRRLLFDSVAPIPDLVVLLDAPGELLFARKREHSPEWIDKQREGYHKLKDRLPQMVIIDASQTADEVRNDVTALIWKKYGSAAR